MTSHHGTTSSTDAYTGKDLPCSYPQPRCTNADGLVLGKSDEIAACKAWASHFDGGLTLRP